MSLAWVIIISVFVASTCLVLCLYLLLPGSESERMAVRLRELGREDKPVLSSELRPKKMASGIQRVLPALSAPLVPEDRAEQAELQTRLVQAGLYAPNAMRIFLGAKMLLCAGLLAAGLLIWGTGVVDTTIGVLLTAAGGIFGLIAPSFWLDSRIRSRQTALRRALPDGVDMLVVCLEGGTSLLSALQRVAVEIRRAHPMLADEWGLVLRATEMGQRPGDALKQLAARFDLEELRRFASIVLESERFGTSVGKSLRVMAQSIRFQRHQRAEELARQAEVKILFPTIVFIMPCVFLVILFPSVVRLEYLFRVVGNKF